MSENRCEACGKRIVGSYYTTKQRQLVCYECWKKITWDRILNSPNVFLCLDQVYTWDKSEKCEGFSGRRFDLTFDDGTKIIDVGMWLNGTLPKEYKDFKLPVCTEMREYNK